MVEGTIPKNGKDLRLLPLKNLQKILEFLAIRGEGPDLSPGSNRVNGKILKDFFWKLQTFALINSFNILYVYKLGTTDIEREGWLSNDGACTAAEGGLRNRQKVKRIREKRIDDQ